MLLASTTAVLSSCLKDKDFEDRKYGMDGVSDIQLVEIAEAPEIVYALDYVNVDTTFGLFTVHLNTAQPAAQDIQVTLVKNDAIVDAYNADNGTHFVVPPSSVYSLPNNLVVTIPKGSRDGQLAFKANPVQLSAEEYALGFSIESTTGGSFTASKNYKDIFVYIGVKNKWEGTYESEGYLYHPTASRDVHEDKAVTTVNPRAVRVTLGDLGTSNYAAVLTIDANNKVTITAAPGAAGAPYTQFDSGLPSSNPGYVPGWSGSASTNNTYDPVAKKFYLRYGYMGSNGWRVTEEILTMK